MISWQWLWQTLLGALRLDDVVFEELRDDADGFKHGLIFLVSIALIVGLVVGAASFVTDVRADPISEIEEVRTEMRDAIEQMGEFGLFEGDEEVLENILDNIEAGMGLGADIVEVVEDTTPAPSAVVHLFEAIAQWLTRPFSWIALWMVWGILTLIFARLMGGTATIQKMLATTSLVAAPHILDAAGWITCVGPLIAILAWLWGIAVYIKGTAVANRFGYGPAVIAVLLPILVPGVIAFAMLFIIAMIATIS